MVNAITAFRISMVSERITSPTGLKAREKGSEEQALSLGLDYIELEEIHEVKDRLICQTVCLTGAEGGYLLLAGENPYSSFLYEEGECEATPVDMAHSAEREAILRGEPTLLRDVPLIGAREARGLHLCVPLITRNIGIGALTIFSISKKINHLLPLIENAARHAASAIHFIKVTRLIERQRVIYILDDYFESANSIGAMLRFLTSATQKSFGADFALFYQRLSEGSKIKIPPLATGLTLQTKRSEEDSITPDTDSIIAGILNLKKPFFCDDLLQQSFNSIVSRSLEGDDITLLKSEKVRSLAGIPLIINGGIVGVLFLCHRLWYVYDPSEKELLRIISAKASCAIRDVITRNKLAVLNETGRALSDTATSTPAKILDLVYRETSRLMDVTNFFIALYDDRTDTITFRFATEGGEKQKLGVNEWAPRTAGNGLTEHVLRTGKPCLVPKDLAAWTAEMGIQLIGRSSKSWLGVPLRVRSSVFGVIAVQNYEHGGAYTDEDSAILSTIASQAAIAIDNARVNAFQRALLDCIPNAVIAIEDKGRIKFLNEEAARLLEVDRESAIAENIVQFYWDEADAHNVSSLLSKGEAHKDIATFARSRGKKKIPISLSAALIKDTEGNPLGSVGVMEDLRLASLRGVIKELFDFFEMLNHESDISKVLEILLLGCLDILDADAGCCLLRDGELFSVERDEGCDRKRLDSLVVRFGKGLLGSIAESGDFKVIDGPKEELPLSPNGMCALVIPVGLGGQVRGLLVLESKREEHFHPEAALLTVIGRHAAAAIERTALTSEKLRTQNKLVASSNTIVAGQIATGIAHEVRNGLNNMGLAIRNIKEIFVKSLPAKEQERVTGRLRSAESDILNLAGLVERLFRFAKGLEPRKASVHVNDVVRLALSLTESTARERKCKLVPSLDSTLNEPSGETGGHPIVMDASQIQQVIINLILNALDATQGRGRIDVVTKRHSPEESRPEAEIAIKDFGSGISDKDLRRVFNPFYTTKAHGTGLGLYISDMLVCDNHQGRIEVETKVGRGSTFSVFLPFDSSSKGG